MKVKFYEKETEAIWEINYIKSIIFDCPLKSKKSQKYVLTTYEDNKVEYYCSKFILFKVEQ